ncbi:hypothetical protein [Saccharibacillus sacchari]|uniref:hypothetical protein n=1 Tax=Saccharibacillus sacchari TaxID=456493 RepID=UPI0005639F1B|nr:hypothetical protein [Saccharibacillus sacchari]
MKLLKANELKNLNYIELFPGVLSKGYLNEESVYVDDDSFAFLVPAISRGFQPYTSFARFEIQKIHWDSIIKELVNLREIIVSRDKERLTGYISTFFWKKSLYEWMLENYKQANIVKLPKFIDELIDWIKDQSKRNEVITLIGL